MFHGVYCFPSLIRAAGRLSDLLVKIRRVERGSTTIALLHSQDTRCPDRPPGFCSCSCALPPATKRSSLLLFQSHFAVWCWKFLNNVLLDSCMYCDVEPTSGKTADSWTCSHREVFVIVS